MQKNIFDYFKEATKIAGTDKFNQVLKKNNSPLTKYMPQNSAPSNSDATKQEPVLIRKTSIYDDDAEELTPAGEAAFREGFASVNDEDEQSNALAKVRAAVKEGEKQHKKVAFLGDLPLDKDSYNWGTYQYVDRNLTAAQNRNKYLDKKTGKYDLKEPAGSFGIALSKEPEIVNTSGKNQVNYIFGFDTKYTDQNGVIQPSAVPNWVFNRDAIKQHNNERIDKFTDALMKVTPESKKGKLADIADSVKKQQALKVDKKIIEKEGKYNSIVEDSTTNKVNRKIAEAVDSIPKVADSKAFKALKTGGKAVSVAGDVLQLADTAFDIYDDYKDDGKLGKKTVKQLVGVAGDFGGAAIGAKAGAALFGAIAGVASAGVFAAPAAMLGGIIGGIVGGIAGEGIAEGAFELIT